MALTQRHVVITDQEYELPYSKGLMASEVMATGLAPARAFHVAEVIEVNLDRFAGKAVAVQLVVTVDEEEAHRSHFLRRARETRNRPPERYLEHFDNIRKLQRYVKSLALQHGVPAVPSYSLDATLSQVIDLVVAQAFEAVPPVPSDEQSQSPNSQAQLPGAQARVGAGSGGEL